MLIDYLIYLNIIFFMLKKNNILIILSKVFLAYLIVQLLNQKVFSLRQSISKEKLKAIANLEFSLNLKQLKTNLDLTE